VQDQTGTVVVISVELLVAVHVVTVLAVRLGKKRVSTSKLPCWYEIAVDSAPLSKVVPESRRFKGGRPASTGSIMGVASIDMSGRKSRGLSVSWVPVSSIHN